MNVNDLIGNLTAYAKAKPGNGLAKVIVGVDEKHGFALGRADDARNGNKLFLILHPNPEGEQVVLRAGLII